MIPGDDEPTKVEELRVSHQLTPCRRQYHRGGKLRVRPLTHDPLETHACAHEANTDKGQRIGPCRVSTRIRNTRLPVLPDGDSCSHGEEGLDQSAESQPCPGFTTHLVADAGDGCAKDECDERAEGLLICDMERVVVLAIEKAGEGKAELYSISGLKSTPHKNGRETDSVNKTSHKTICRQWSGGFVSIDIRQ